MAAQASALELHTLTSSDDTNLLAVLALSNDIFDADPASKHGSLAAWQERLSRLGSSILFLAPATPDGAAPRPVAFAFLIPRITRPPLKNGVSEFTHIWIAGTHPDWRKAGCLATLIRALDTVQHLTVCTFPARFPDMWAWLNRRGWVQERELEEGKFLLSRSQ